MYVRAAEGEQGEDRVAREPARRDGPYRKNPDCPYELGDKVRFVPAANKGASAGFGGELRVEVTATVVQIHAEHRWYRTAWEMCPGCIGHETFKF